MNEMEGQGWSQYGQLSCTMGRKAKLFSPAGLSTSSFPGGESEAVSPRSGGPAPRQGQQLPWDPRLLQALQNPQDFSASLCRHLATVFSIRPLGWCHSSWAFPP